MTTDKYGFVYIWYDRKHKRYYIGSHWGTENDGYICSSQWMKRSYERRPEDFKRRIVKRGFTDRKELICEEDRWIKMIKPSEIKPQNENPRYYNLRITAPNMWHTYPENIKTVGEKISASKKGKNTGPRNASVGIAISKAKKGKAFTEEHKAALAEAQRGKKQSPEQIAKKSESLKKAWAIRKLEAKWKPILDHSDIPVIKASHKRNTIVWHEENCEPDPSFKRKEQ